MVKHKFCNPSSSPLRVSKDERNTGLCMGHVRHHECKRDDQFAVNNDAAEVRILKTLGNCNLSK